MKPCAITGLGLVSPMGIGYPAFYENLQSAVAPFDDLFRDRPSMLSDALRSTAIAAEVQGFEPAEHLGERGLRNLDRVTKFLIVAARQALHDAGLKREGAHVVPAARMGVTSATAYGSLEAINEMAHVTELENPRFLNPGRFPNTVINSAAGYVSIWESLQAPNVTVADGNCGALDAVISAERHLANQRADAMLVGGGEALSDPLYLAFKKLGVMAEAGRSCKPGRPDSEGMRLGEGACYLALERSDFAALRGARVRAELIGYSNVFEAPESDAALTFASSRAVQRAIGDVLGDASLEPRDVDLVVASVSGIAAFDQAELAGVRAALADVPVAAPKTYFGETLGAGGALALASAVAWLEDAPMRALIGDRSPGSLEHVLVLATGYYGNASAVMLRKARR